jgi:hypothetical protein
MIMKLIAGRALNSEPWGEFSFPFSGYTGTGILIGREEMMVVKAFWLRLRGLYFPSNVLSIGGNISFAHET